MAIRPYYNVQDDLSIRERILAPKPKFFKRLRAVGITLGAVGTALLSAEVVLPEIVTTIAGYLVTAGAVIAAITSTTVDVKEYSLRTKKK